MQITVIIDMARVCLCCLFNLKSHFLLLPFSLSLSIFISMNDIQIYHEAVVQLRNHAT